MKTTIRLRFGLLFLLGLPFGCSGSCSDGKVVVNEASILFTYPLDGESIGPTQDVNPSALGVQINVLADVTNLDTGDPLYLWNSTDGATRRVEGTVADGHVTFPSYTLPNGTATLYLAVPQWDESMGCEGLRCARVTVTVMAAECQFNTPRNGDILTAEDPRYVEASPLDPFEIDVVLDCVGGAMGDVVELRVNAGLARTAQLDESGRVTFARIALAEGPNALAAVPMVAGEPGTIANATVTVDTPRCLAAIEPVDGSILLAVDDGDLNSSNGMQATLDLVTDCDAASTITLYLRGPSDAEFAAVTLATAPAVLADPLGSRFRLRDVTLPESALPEAFDVQVIGVVQEAGGQAGATVPNRYWIDSASPLLLSYAPNNGQCIGPTGDIYPEIPGIQTDGYGLVSGVEDGAEAWITVSTADEPAPSCASDAECNAPLLCRDGACRSVGTVSGGTFTVAQVPLLAGDAVIVSFVVHDLAGNPSAAADATIAVYETAPTLTIVSPTDGAGLGASADLDPLEPGLQYAVHLSFTNVVAGTTGAIITDEASFAIVPSAGAATTGDFTVDLSDGAHTLSARITDSCGNVVETPTIGLLVSSEPPLVAVTPYVADNSVCAPHDEIACASATGCMWNATGTASCVADYSARQSLLDGATLRNGLVDLEVVTGVGVGPDRSVQVSLYPSFDFIDGVRQCTGLATDGPSAIVPATAVGALLIDVPLVSGPNCLLVTADDTINPLSVVIVLNRKDSVPGIAITSPAAGTVTDSNDTLPGFNQTVVVALDSADTTDGTLTLAYSAGPVSNSESLPMVAGATTTTFTDASLPYGTITLTATYVDQYGNSAISAAVVIVAASPGPEIIITSPVSGAQLANAAFVAQVTYIGGGTPGALTCDLLVDEVINGAAVAWPDPVASPLTMDTATDVADGLHNIRVACGLGTTQTVQVTFDGTAPATPVLRNEDPPGSGKLDFTTPGYVNLLTADTSAQAGLQHSVDVLVTTGGQNAVGWVVTLVVTPSNTGTPTSYTHTIAGSGDPILVTFNNVNFGFDTITNKLGTLAFLATVTDVAQNASTAATATLPVDLDPPVLVQTKPDPAKLKLTRADDINSDPTYVEVRFEYAVTGATGSVSFGLSPIPVNKVEADFPMLLPVATPPVSTSTLSLADNVYVAVATAVDAAGNTTTPLVYNFEVYGLEPRVNWAIAPVIPYINRSHDTDGATSGIQVGIGYNVVGVPGGTKLKICSSVPTAGAVATCGAPPDDLNCCRWHADGSERTDFASTDLAAGVVVATAFLSGTVTGSTALLSGVSLADGVQDLHAEVIEPDRDPSIYSLFRTYEVDSVPPAVTSFVFSNNSTANDPVGALRLGPSEQAVVTGKLRTMVTVEVAGSADGRAVTVTSDVPTANTVVSAAGTTLSGGAATFTLDLAEGRQTLMVHVSDPAGNVNTATSNPVAVQDVVVDFTPGTVSLSGPLHGSAPYTSADGTVDTHGTPTASDDTLGVAITVSVGDNQTLESAKVTLRSYSAAVGGTLLSSQEVTLAHGQVTADFAAFPLFAGLNYLVAELTDAAGNVTTTARVMYPADFYGPDLLLQAWTGRSGTPVVLDCATQGSPCLGDYLDPTAGNNGRARLDFLGTDAYALSPATGGTDLRVAITSAVNSDVSLETGASTILLESRVAGSVVAFAPVYESSGSVPGAVALTSYDQLAGMGPYALDPGEVREVRLVALDSNNNRSVSQSIFLRLDLSGVIVTVERLSNTLVATGDMLADDKFFGPMANVAAAPIFQTHFRVHVTPLGSGVPVVLDVDLAVNGSSMVNQPVAGGVADFLNTQLVTSPHPGDRLAAKLNTVSVTVNCLGLPSCGGAEYLDIVADLDPPSFQFDRCTLCNLNVPLVGASVCASACPDTGAFDGDTNANMVGSASPAIWNAARDQDSSPGNGFTILSAVKPLSVRVLGLESGQQVSLTSNQGGLTGASVAAGACSGVSCAATVTFGNLGVPSLSGTLSHQIQVSFTDSSGNVAVADPARGAETLYARTDVVAPGSATATVCIGGSTTPTGVSPPESDPATYENPACTAKCVATSGCDRRKGKATLYWQAPAEDGAAGSKVTSYQVLVAARGVSYSGTTYTQCATLDPTAVEQTVTVAATANPGAEEVATIVDLYPHRAYCFAVLGVDDVGNRANVSGVGVERSLPLVNYPNVVAFNPVSQDDSAAGGALYAGGADFGNRAVTIGDMDGDGRDDFAVAQRTSAWTVSVFVSGQSTSVPHRVIAAPSIAPGGFGTAMAGGDFDGDGRADLAICATTATAPGPLTNAGALFLYYGIASTGLRGDVNSADTTLPGIYPDVAVFGPAGAYFCDKVAIGNIDGLSGQDLLVSTSSGGNRDKVYGFLSTGRSRFPGGPPTAIIALNLDQEATPGIANRPDFALRSKLAGFSNFPISIALADVDGDGLKDVAVADSTAAHDGIGTCTSCGEVYIYKGGAGLAGEMDAPDAAPSPVMHVLRYVPAQNFGQNMLAVPAPLSPADSADWLLVEMAATFEVIAFRGTSIGATPGITPAVYPANGLKNGSGVPDATLYSRLDKLDWQGVAVPRFGDSMAVIGDLDGHGGVDIAIGPAYPTPTGRYAVGLYSLDLVDYGFKKRAFFYGTAGTRGFGAAVFGVKNFVSAAVPPEIQLGITNRSATGSVYLFR